MSLIRTGREGMTEDLEPLGLNCLTKAMGNRKEGKETASTGCQRARLGSSTPLRAEGK